MLNKFKLKPTLLLIGVFILILLGIYQVTKVSYVSTTAFKLGTVVKIDVWTKDPQVTHAILDRLDELENTLSLNIDTSEVSQINHQSGIQPVKISADTYEIIKTSLNYSHVSQGLFDISIGPISTLWGIGSEKAHVPSQQELDQYLKKVGFQNILLDEENQSVFLTSEGMKIDLGGIAKGYAADEIIKILNTYKVKKAIINLGGNVFVHGEKSTNRLWEIGIQDPFKPQGEIIGVVKGKDITVVTSGNNERYFMENGIRYHHILSPKDGYPINSDIAAVTIVGPRSIDADALSTTVFSLGSIEGLELIDSSYLNYEAIIVKNDHTILLSQGAEKYFSEKTNENK